MKTTLRVHEPKEILSLVPYQLGFTPANSIVVISLRGIRKRVGLVARVDAGELRGEHSYQVARELVAHCVADGAAKLVVVAYGDPRGTDAQGTDSEIPDLLRSVSAFLKVARPELGVEEVLAVSAGNYGHFSVLGQCLARTAGELAVSDLVHSTLCIDHTRRTTDFGETNVAAHMVFEGRTTVAGREELGMVAKAQQTARTIATKSYRKSMDKYATLGPRERQSWQERSIGRWHEAFSEPVGTSISESLVGKIAAMLTDIPVRDAVLVSFTSLGADKSLRFIKAQTGGVAGRSAMDEIARAAIAEITDPESAKRPAPAKLERAREILTAVIATVDTHQHLAARTLLALLAWWEGHGALAKRHLEESGAIAAGYSLAGLVDTALSYGLAPGWQRGAKEKGADQVS